MQILGMEPAKPPKHFRFLKTSRPEVGIVEELGNCPALVCAMEHDYTSGASRCKVLSYLDHEMRQVLESGALDSHEVEVILDALGAAAGGLFIWASTVVKSVESDVHPIRKAKRLVSGLSG